MSRDRDPMNLTDPIDVAMWVGLALALVGTIALAVLKLAGQITWGWGWVLSPILFFILALFFAFIVLLIIAFLEDPNDHDDVDWMQ